MAENGNEIKINLSPEVATGKYANLAVIAHSPSEFVLDFVCVAPNTPAAQVQSRIIMTPENAKQLFFALQENLQKYEQNFGNIVPKGIPGKGGVPPMSWPGTGNGKA